MESNGGEGGIDNGGVGEENECPLTGLLGELSMAVGLLGKDGVGFLDKGTSGFVLVKLFHSSSSR